MCWAGDYGDISLAGSDQRIDAKSAGLGRIWENLMSITSVEVAMSHSHGTDAAAELKNARHSGIFLGVFTGFSILELGFLVVFI